MRRYTPVLTIAGSDPSGGAGIQADIKTIASTGCYAMSVITAITVQNTQGVKRSVPVDTNLVTDQLNAILEDITPAAIKIGMIPTPAIATAIACTLKTDAPATPLIVDPVMISTSGHALISPETVNTLIDELLPLATIITPNIHELKALTPDCAPDTDIATRVTILRNKGIKSILITGGDSDINAPYANDLLFLPGSDVDAPVILKADRVKTQNTHGTGCTLSSAIAAFTALGFPLIDAVKAAKSYITRALISGANIKLGHGHGPVNHSFGPRRTRFLTNH